MGCASEAEADSLKIGADRLKPREIDLIEILIKGLLDFSSALKFRSGPLNAKSMSAKRSLSA
jgi:hypothetical protein